MPSELFYTINFSFSITALVIGLIFSLSTIFIIIINRECHTVNYLLTGDLCVTLALYFIFALVACVYGLRDDWEFDQPLCILRAYCITAITAASCYSFLIQSISQLFFTNFYKHRFLLTWRTHWILIALKWFTSLLLSIEPFFVSDGFRLIEEYRTCSVTTNIPSVAVYCIIVIFIFPGTIVSIIYVHIFNRVRQSTRRIAPNIGTNSILTQNTQPSGRKHLKIMQNMLILMNIFTCGGTPYLILTIWDLIQHQSVPKEFFCISVNFITLSSTIMMAVALFKNKQMKDIVFRYVFRHVFRHPPAHP